jgi:hypothetical protein
LGFDSDEAYLAGREAITKRQRKEAARKVAKVPNEPTN